MIDMRDILKQALPQADEQALERFEIYHRLLAEWNERMNLTAITDPVEVAEKHFADSLAALPYLKAGMKVIDVGTGAGFPGVPLLIMEPGLELTLADSLQKRLTFLDALLKELGLKAALVHGRAEDLGQNKLYRERYDVALSRAVANLPVLLELGRGAEKRQIGGLFAPCAAQERGARFPPGQAVFDFRRQNRPHAETVSPEGRDPQQKALIRRFPWLSQKREKQYANRYMK